MAWLRKLYPEATDAELLEMNRSVTCDDAPLPTVSTPKMPKIEPKPLPSKRKSVTLYHGTLRKDVPSILKNGLRSHPGYGGAGTEGVYLTNRPATALYWAKSRYQLEHEEHPDTERFDRHHGQEVGKLLAVLQVVIPASNFGNLFADMEQSEDVQFDGDESDWEAGLKAIGDVRYGGTIPPQWISLVK
jgi:hypothetical protein